MPELPEVETVKESLKKILLNKKITGISIFYDGILESDINPFLNQRITNIKRYGKFLVIMSDIYALIIHLRMEGKFFLKEISEPKEKHEHVEFIVDGKESLRYHDTRKFGKMYLRKTDELFKTYPLNALGKEPFDITSPELFKHLKNKSVPIKVSLLDQSIISGIGNIYADEILFLSKILPTRKSHDVTEAEVKSIIDNSVITLNKAIELGGTTIHSYNALGVSGKFQNELLVHGRASEPCFVCGNKIIKTRVGGRGTYVCEFCQK